ncbi:MAG: excinuclease ABC subunit UvrA [Dehalococcoidia bacterium]|nr:excinuclease ABC subunit UvrA [Dehalococcoidia bacterium]
MENIVVRGAREHNLKNVDVTIPRNKLVVITGVSGSGKSSLAFDTIYAEGQRRYVESLSAYARQFLGRMEKPDVDYIEGLSPAISIDQKGASHNPRSTVGTITEVYDHLRLLYARVGLPHCPQCGRPVQRQTTQQIVDAIFALPPGTRIMLMAPVIRDRKGEHLGVLEEARKKGFSRARVDGKLHELSETVTLDKNKRHTVEIVVDRLVVNGELEQGRVANSVDTALRLAEGVMGVSVAGEAGSDASAARPSTGSRRTGKRAGRTVEAAASEPPADLSQDRGSEAGRTGNGAAPAHSAGPGQGQELIFSQKAACAYCGISLGELEPRSFSFNSPHGACAECTGLGFRLEVDPDLVIPNKDLSLAEGAIQPWVRSGSSSAWYASLLESLAKAHGFSTRVPVRQLSDDVMELILRGNKSRSFTMRHHTHQGRQYSWDTTFEGVIPNLSRRYKDTESEYIRQEIERYMAQRPCASCEGLRLKPEVLGVTVCGRNIMQVCSLSIEKALTWADVIQDRDSAKIAADTALSERDLLIAGQVLKEIKARLKFLLDVGLDYLTVDRMAATLSGGEAQRIRLATQIGSGLMGVLYVCDEPTIGLHPADDQRLIETLKHLRDLGNTVLLVEHDEAVMRAADYIVDMGPGAGEHGGHLVAFGTPQEVMDNEASITGAYLSGRRTIPLPKQRRPGSGANITLKGARANNLKDLTVEFPLGMLVCVTGVSGSGKSTLVYDVLYKRLAQLLYKAKDRPGDHDAVLGTEHVDKVINIDQSPIGRTPRSNPATYVGAFTPIRELFSALPDAKARGYGPGRFSFNVKGGRCEACQGDGYIQIEMQFLPDVTVPCEVCKGARYDREALEVKYHDKSIADVLNMTVDEAMPLFQNIPAIRNKLDTMQEVGLGYIRIGQPATTLSGGEAQRVKLATELSRRATGRTLYILDEPTTGLSFEDAAALLRVLHRLADAGNTVLVIEHHLDVIKNADWIIDLGPGPGDRGGEIIAMGTPEEVAGTPGSSTGDYLRPLLAAQGKVGRPPRSSQNGANGARAETISVNGNGAKPSQRRVKSAQPSGKARH